MIIKPLNALRGGRPAEKLIIKIYEGAIMYYTMTKADKMEDILREYLTPREFINILKNFENEILYTNLSLLETGCTKMMQRLYDGNFTVENGRKCTAANIRWGGKAETGFISRHRKIRRIRSDDGSLKFNRKARRKML